MKRVITILVIVAVLAVGGYFGYQFYLQSQAAAQNIFQTIKVGKGNLTAVVGATGVVHANQSGVIVWQTSGLIGKLNAKTGDRVLAGMNLAELDPKSISQALILAKADLVTAQRNLDSLKNSTVASAKAFQNLVAAQKELDDAKTKRQSKQYDRSSQENIDVARANLAVAEDQLQKAQDYYNIFASRDEKDVLRAQALSSLANATQNRDRQLANLNWLIGKPDQTEINESDARVVVAEASLADAQREYDRLKDGPDPSDIAAAEARVAAAQSTLDMVHIESPFMGTITDTQSKIGDQVNPGTVSFRIDDLSRLLVDVQITEVDINRIKIGQPASLTFDAIQGKEYKGKVVDVGQVGANAAGVVNFTVTVELTDADGQVRPGMTAAVNIVTDQLQNVLLVPNRAVRLRDGKRVVYLNTIGLPKMTEITLGLTSDLYSQALAGIKEGDVLVLNPPAEFQNGPMGGPPSGQ